MKRFALLVGVPVLVAAVFLFAWLRGGRYEETENAYVKAHIIAVSADVSGRVVEVAVRDNQSVEAGALLFRIDPAPFALAVARAEAQMAVVRTEVESLRAEHRVARAEAAEAESRIDFLERQLARQAKLKEKGMGLESSYYEARHNLDAARRRLEAAKEKAGRALAALGGDPAVRAEAHPSFLAARAARDA
ncbi:MAG TPA: biotin/lipoyl-binding protein, partial [Burkholderiales bacterium]|nr:biotin/lipoyl-binding protein [Burkholderiales bacterium]